MKRLALLLSIISLMITFMSYPIAQAEACVSSPSYGSVDLTLPPLPSKGIYNIWTRLQIPDSLHSQYRLEINKNSCFDVGGSSLTPNQWSWVSFQSGDLTKKVQYTFDYTTDNSVRLIGTNSGVKVDRLLLVKTDCVPVDLGTNCRSDAVPMSNIDTNSAVEVPALTNGPVSGIVIPSSTITQSPLLIRKVVYFSDSTVVPTAYNNGLDTTLLSNGTHRITIQITKTNSTVVNEVTTLNVENPQTTFSSVKRWLRLRARSTIIFIAVIGGVLLIAAGLALFRRFKLKQRLLDFRGF